jgi:hypothetical protein
VSSGKSTETQIRDALRRVTPEGPSDLMEPLVGVAASVDLRGQGMAAEQLHRWAVEEGWPEEAAWMLAGVALAADIDAARPAASTGCASTGDEAPTVCLTRAQAIAARHALIEVLLGPYSIPESEFETLTGVTPGEAQEALEALDVTLDTQSGWRLTVAPGERVQVRQSDGRQVEATVDRHGTPQEAERTESGFRRRVLWVTHTDGNTEKVSATAISPEPASDRASPPPNDA